MTPRLEKLRALAQIAALLAERALPPVAAARDRVAAQQGRIDDMVAQREALAVDGVDPVLAARLASQAQRLRQQQATAMSDLARAQAELELAISAARPALARKAVLERLVTMPGRRR